MPEATLKTKLTGDSAEFKRSMREGIASAKEFGQEVGATIREALLVVGGLTLGIESIGTAFDKTLDGIKGVFELSKDLEHLSDRTGIAVRDLVNLQTEFKLSGLEADQVGQTINKMQRSIADAAEKGGAAAKTYADLGLNLDELKSKSPADEFETIQEKIAAIEDPAKRAQAAMAIFGRSGGELLALFGNAGIGKEAANALGSQADILARNAHVFQEVSADMEAAGIKIQGFFVGLAEPISHVILPVLNKLESIDLTKYGTALGDSVSSVVRVLYNAFEDGKLSNVMELSLKAAFQEAGNWLIGTVPAFGDAIADVFDSDFAAHVSDVFDGIAMEFGAAMLNAMGAPIAAMQAAIAYPARNDAANAQQGALREEIVKIEKEADQHYKIGTALRGQGNDAGADREYAIADKYQAGVDDMRKQLNDWNATRNMSMSDFIQKYMQENQATMFGATASDISDHGAALMQRGEDGLGSAAARLATTLKDEFAKMQPSTALGNDAAKQLAILYNAENKPLPGQGTSNGPDKTGVNFDADDSDKDEGKTKTVSSAWHSAGRGTKDGVSGFHKEDDGTWVYYSGLGQDAVDFHNTGSAARAGRSKAPIESGSRTDAVIQKMGADISAIKSKISSITAPE